MDSLPLIILIITAIFSGTSLFLIYKQRQKLMDFNREFSMFKGEYKESLKTLNAQHRQSYTDILTELRGKKEEEDARIESETDSLYEIARDIVVKAGNASTSYLQQKLRIGYARAAQLIDMLEENEVIASGEGAAPRQVLMTKEELAEETGESE